MSARYSYHHDFVHSSPSTTTTTAATTPADTDLQRHINPSKYNPNNEDKILQILQKNPSAAKAKYVRYFGPAEYPIYLFIQQRASYKLIQALHKAFPQAAKEMYAKKKTLLHCACINRASLETASLLIKEWPEAAMIQDVDGRIPLHYACAHSSTSFDLISFLLQHDPSSIKIKDDRGRLPLHWSCMKHPSFKVLSVLLKQYPHAVQVEDRSEATPLDILNQNFSSSTIRDQQKTMVHGISSLLLLQKKEEETSKKKIITTMQIMNDFIAIEWWDGVVLVLDLSSPSSTVAQCLEGVPLNVIPCLLSMIGQRGKMSILWKIVRSRQDVLKID